MSRQNSASHAFLVLDGNRFLIKSSKLTILNIISPAKLLEMWIFRIKSSLKQCIYWGMKEFFNTIMIPLVLRPKTSRGLQPSQPLPSGQESTHDNSYKSENISWIGAWSTSQAQATQLCMVVPVVIVMKFMLIINMNLVVTEVQQ